MVAATAAPQHSCVSSFAPSSEPRRRAHRSGAVSLGGVKEDWGHLHCLYCDAHETGLTCSHGWLAFRALLYCWGWMQTLPPARSISCTFRRSVQLSTPKFLGWAEKGASYRRSGLRTSAASFPGGLSSRLSLSFCGCCQGFEGL